jgi:hypothetical protein
LRLLPKDTRRAILLAQSLLATHGQATTVEIETELGPNWVIARRTKQIVEKYGDDVKCVNSTEYHAAERRAIEKRYPK